MKINWKYICIILAAVQLIACEVIPESERDNVIFTPTDTTAFKRT